jgi:hypothetical protein
MEGAIKVEVEEKLKRREKKQAQLWWVWAWRLLLRIAGCCVVCEEGNHQTKHRAARRDGTGQKQKHQRALARQEP